MKSEALVYLILGAPALYLLFTVVRNRGFRGAMFGAPVTRTVGEIDLGRRRMVRTTARAYLLESGSPSAPEIGLEFSSKRFGRWNVFPLALTREQVRVFTVLLAEAAAQVDSRNAG
jgi:hypothetical protein